MADRSEYIYAMKYGWLTPLYDPMMKLTGDLRIKQRLLESAAIRPGHSVLDVGCGTGTLLLLLKSLEPGARAFGLDGDLNILRIARHKTIHRKQGISFERSLANRLPFRDAAFDRVLSSLVFHHIPTEEKRAAFREIHRVLRPGGKVVIADVGPPLTAVTRAASWILERMERTTDNLMGLLPVFAMEAGLTSTAVLGQFSVFFGTIWIFSAEKPAVG